MTAACSAHPQHGTLPGLLRQSASHHPARLAVYDDTRELTYRQLVDEVHRLAAYLIRAGCRPGTRVASALPRSVEAIVAQAAILTAGGVYVPVDPAYPTAVLDHLLRTTQPRLIIGHHRDLRAVPTIPGLSTVILDNAATAHAIAGQSAEPPRRSPQPAEGAYIIHTSGSAGRPKGVLVGHGAIAASTLARRQVYPETVRGFLLVSPMTFDSSMAGVWWTLSQGGTLHLAPTDPAGLVAAVRQLVLGSDSAVSHTLLTPTLYGQVLQGIDKVHTSLRTVVVAGEACPPALVRTHYQLMPDVELVNEYGPTEAAVWCTSTILRPGFDVTIGTAIPGVDTLLLTADGDTVPDGTPGELCIAGAQLADGYIADDALTAARFSPHPHQPDRRIYRSGDRARRRSDGQLELLGRMDDQVKIRGYRIDLAGIRAQISRHSGIADAVVAVRHHTTAGGRSRPILTAYVVPAVDERHAETALRLAWTGVVDEIATTATHRGEAFDTSGWNSSYTGEPLSAQDMNEWVEQTVTLLTEATPVTVLDLGCGTGLPLLRLAPSCGRYVALDISRETLRNLRDAVDRAKLSNVELRPGQASDAADFAGKDFDLVVCNSVSQYFPGGGYLTRTVLGALSATAPGGRAVIGDVRDLSLITALHASVVLAQADQDTTGDVLAARLQRRVAEDAQLSVDPRWFATITQQHPDTYVEVRPRRGRRRNEMNDFRFDAVLHKGNPTNLVEISTWYDWAGDGLDLADLAALLRAGTTVIGVRGIPNARTAGAAAVARALQSGTTTTASELRQLAESVDTHAVHPEHLISLAAEIGFRCHISRMAGHDDGVFDAAFVALEATHGAGQAPLPRFPATATVVSAGPQPALTTEPLRRRIVSSARTTVIPQLRDYLAQVLPVQEQPAAYVALAELPINRHGKVDLAALPDPRTERPPLSTTYVPAGSPVQQRVAALWAQLLGIDQVGVDDHFTELGGDSLLAAQCAVTLTEMFGVTLPSGTMFSATTVRAIAQAIEQAQAAEPEPTVTEASVRQRQPDGILPLNSAQTTFWYIDHYRRPGSARHPNFALPVHYRISGLVDAEALSTAVDHLVQRHESLRTTVLLAAEDGQQRVNPAVPGLMVHRRIHPADPHAALREAAKSDAQRALATEQGRVFTVELTSASDTEHLLVIRVHHMVADGWSLDIIERELQELYRATVAGRVADLPPAPSYSDLVRRTDQTFFDDLNWRQDPTHRDALEYWQTHTAGAAPIQLTEPLTGQDGSDTRVRSVLLSGHDTDTVLDAARHSHATLFSSMLAVLAQLFVADYGDADIRLMALTAARDTPELDRMVGLLLNPLFVRVPARPGTPFAEAAAAAGELVRGALSHAHVPVLALCEEIPQLLRIVTESQFIAVESLPPARGIHIDGCVVRRSDPFDEDFLGTSFILPVDLLLLARAEDSGVRLSALYDPASFDDAYIRRLLERLRLALVAGANDPQAPLRVPIAAEPQPRARH